MERYAFIMRGMITHEMRRRCTTCLLGGRSNKDDAGEGIQSKLRELAGKMNVAYSTVASDERIYRVFFADRAQTALTNENSLPRAFYVTALTLDKEFGEDKAREVITTATQQLSLKGSDYKYEDFQKYTRDLLNSKGKPEAGELLKERVARKTISQLNDLVASKQMTRAKVVEEAILAMSKSQTNESELKNEQQQKSLFTQNDASEKANEAVSKSEQGEVLDL